MENYYSVRLLGDSSIIVSDVREEALPPSVARLYQSYPNPFNPRTVIRYDLNQASSVTLEIFDISGRKVKTLVDRKEAPGSHEVLFDAESLASGVYLYRLTVKTARGDLYENTKRLTLLK